MINFNERLESKIRDLRRESRLTQEELAHRAGLDFSYLNQIENGRRNPSLEAIGRIARALGIPVRDLISF